MVEFRRHRRRLGIALLVALAAVVGAAAFDRMDEPEVADPCQPRPAAPPAELALMPARLSFDEVGTVTRVQRNEPHIMVQAISTKPIDELTVLIQDAVTAAGYRPAGMDNEGFEAEVFFQAGTYAAGQALVRQFGCKGRWDIDLVLLDRDAVPERGTVTTSVP
jgi:cell division septation protein DedD